MDHLPLRAGGEMEEVIGRYRSTVYGLALAKTNSPADADDIFQEVFIAYFQSSRVFREEEHRKAWLLRTTLNQCRRLYRSARRRETVALTGAEPAPVFQRAEENALWEALCALREDYRLPLYLFYFEELSTAQIAAALSLRPGTVRMRLSRGREQLREALKGEIFDE